MLALWWRRAKRLLEPSHAHSVHLFLLGGLVANSTCVSLDGLAIEEGVRAGPWAEVLHAARIEDRGEQVVGAAEAHRSDFARRVPIQLIQS